MTYSLLQQAIERGTGDNYWGGNETPWLSIKCMFNGPAYYETDDNGRFRVDDERYLILNHNQAYTIHKPAGVPVETFCIFFPPDWANDILQTLTRPGSQLLDTPFPKNQQPIQFFEQSYPHNPIVTPYLRHLRQQIKAHPLTDLELTEHLYRILTAMMHQHHNLRHDIAQLPYQRHSTRVELYHRLHRTRDYMLASLAEPLTLPELAKIAALSPYHFLRMFKQQFGQTPHAHLVQLRLQRAATLLTTTKQTITNICFAVGFQSLGSFSSRFQRQFGLSPRAYRQAHPN